jgi:hypothetical protein
MITNRDKKSISGNQVAFNGLIIAMGSSPSFFVEFQSSCARPSDFLGPATKEKAARP